MIVEIEICLSCHNPKLQANLRKSISIKSCLNFYFKLNLCWYIWISPLFLFPAFWNIFFASDALKALTRLLSLPFFSKMMMFFSFISTPEGKNKKQTLYYVFCVAVFMYCYVFFIVHEDGSESSRCCCFCFSNEKEADAMFLILPFFFVSEIHFFSTKLVCRLFFFLSQLIVWRMKADIMFKGRKKRFFLGLTQWKAFWILA